MTTLTATNLFMPFKQPAAFMAFPLISLDVSEGTT